MTPESNRVFTVGMEWRGRREEKGREAPIASRTQNLEPSRRQDSPAATYLCQKGIKDMVARSDWGLTAHWNLIILPTKN